jgi:leucyl-tRNA synthetase
MHVDLARRWIRVQALLALPIIPHYAEHVWTTILGETSSVQHARWPEPTAPVDQLVLDGSNYVHATIKRARDAEAVLAKKKAKGKGAAYDPAKPKALNIFVARRFPEWQDAAVSAVKEAYDEKTETVDRAKLKEVIIQRDLIKDKRVMPFCVQFEVRSMPARLLWLVGGLGYLTDRVRSVCRNASARLAPRRRSTVPCSLTSARSWKTSSRISGGR